jgi:hypothetical protein
MTANKKALPMNRPDQPGSASNHSQNNNAHASESQQKPCLACALWPVVKRLREERIAREAAGLEFGEVLPCD